MTSATVAVQSSEINADESEFARMDAASMEWVKSPAPGVWRKRFELIGDAEKGLVTSLVKYEPGSSFPSHDHPGGEEFLVLDGVFSDEHGDYPAGTYVLNVPGFIHAPFTREGCTIFVKLRQYPGVGRERVVLDTTTMDWQHGSFPKLRQKTLYQQDGFPEVARLIKAEPGCEVPMHDHPGGEEVYILEGEVEDENGVCGAGAWIRQPVGSSHSVVSRTGALIYVRTGRVTAR